MKRIKSFIKIAWAAKSDYIKRCSDEETSKKNLDIFMIIYAFAAIVSGLFALSLLSNNKVRVGLYIILTVLIINALAIQICIFYYKL